MLQAQEMADTVQLGELTKFDYRELTVSIGPIPSVRICWRPEGTTQAEEVAQPAKTAPIPPPVTQMASTAPQSAFTQTAYFEKRTPLPPPVPTATTATTPPVAAFAAQPIRVPLPAAEAPAAETTSAETKMKQDPLARFKKMPDLLRFKR